jgi:hypothetical protein
MIAVMCSSSYKLTRLGIVRRGFGSAEYSIPIVLLGESLRIQI